MNSIRASIAEAVQRVRQGALASLSGIEGFESVDDEGGHDKTASYEAGEDPYGDLADRLDQTAAALSGGPSLPDLLLGRAKQASAFHNVGGGKEMPTSMPSATKGKQPLNMGQARQQLEKSKLKRVNPGESPSAFEAKTAEGLDKKAPANYGHGRGKEASLLEIVRQKVAGIDGNEENPNITNRPSTYPSNTRLMGEGAGTGAPGAKLVSSNKAAKDFTPWDAAKLQNGAIRTYLDQPAFSRTNDPVPHANLSHASKAGVKVASLADIIKRRAK